MRKPTTEQATGQDALLEALDDLRCARGHLSILKTDPDLYRRLTSPIGNAIGILRKLTDTSAPAEPPKDVA